ncbi:type VI secretion system tube protein TssD [Nissabacter sp. SGAir0207]|uniref:type VI secretion system tube protein TssD n=1 Tax=Nissabacter sp. SGAir0207 TaxID=2126321 RepID=UPI0010CD15AE|nr:type VI secretion system tube protein TssD [Nissabacter sp. SGAir0207]QCR36115.1 hypothetical protein C1N62_08435 [Nissabacter sp. SGAir0207]
MAIPAYLYRASCINQKLKSATLKWYQINHAGQEQAFLITQMENVVVINMQATLPHVHHAACDRHSPPYESFSLMYERITWHYLEGNILFSDQWSEGH